jgi:hypothetical protein
MMAVLTYDIQLPHRGVDPRRFVKLPLAGYTNFGAGSVAHTVYHGSVVVCDVSDTDGYFRACPAGATTNSAAGDIFGGIALERVDVTSSNTADGSKEVTVARDGVWGFAKGSVAQTDVGAAIYASDDQTVTTTSTNNFWIGYLVEVDSTYAWVDISRAAGMANSAT